MRIIAVFICLAIVFCVFPASALSRVTVYDMVVQEGQKVMLRAETRGKLLSKGGELVEFFVDGESIGKTLSGGDGVAFKQFTSVKTGLRQISVRSDKDEDTGLLLSLKRGAGIVFVDVEGSLLEGLFSWKPRHGSRKAIEEIQKGFTIVYLQTSVVGLEAVKAWIEENEFPKSPVVPWRHGAIFNELVKKGFRIKAVISGPKVIESAEEYKPLAFSFETSEDAEKVKDWEEIRNSFMNKFQNLSTTVIPVESHLFRSVSSQKALDMSQLWKVFPGHDTRTLSKMGLSPHGGVAGRLKILTHSRVFCAFSPPRACPEP